MQVRRQRGIRSAFARTKAVILLTGVAMVALGIAVLLNPLAAVEALVRTLGWILVVYGVITLIAAFAKGDPVKNSPVELGLGCAALVPGLIMGIYPAPFVRFVWTFLGILVLVTGVLDIVEAGDFRRVGSPLAVPATVSGVITVVMGIVVVFAPAFSAAIAMLFAAVALVVDGITEIIFGLGV